MLVGGAGEGDAAELADRAAGAVAAGDPGGDELAARAVGVRERGRDAVGLLLEGDQLRAPLHGLAECAQLVAHDALVVVLAEDQDERIGRDGSPGLAQGNARHLASLRPDVGAGAALAEIERPLDDAELGVDLQRARLHAQRPRLQRRPGMAVDDERAHAAADELVGEHQPGGPGADDQNVRIHRGGALRPRLTPSTTIS